MPPGATKIIPVEYENPDFVVVNKPAGLPVYSTKKHEQEDSVVSLLLPNYPQLRQVGDPERPGIVHRLDKQTSGLLLVAKTPAGFSYLKSLFAGRKIIKEYLALVYGETPPHGIIDEPLTKIGHEGQSRVRVDVQGKEAVTEYWALENYIRPLSQPLPTPGERGVPPQAWGGKKGEVADTLDQFTLVRIKLHTGRTHQIRVHLAEIKHPVMGDDLYGKPHSLKLKDILPRQFLHASRLEFRLPDNTWLEVQSQLPKDLETVLSQLQHN